MKGKAVLISIASKWCDLIANGKKTVEIRKSRPKIDTPFKCYIYCTKAKTITDKLLVLNKEARKEYYDLKAVCANLEPDSESSIGNGKVIGEFVCDNIIKWLDEDPPPVPLKETCLSYMDIRRYASNDETLFCWHISNLKIYDTPKELVEFRGYDSECFFHAMREYGCKDLDGKRCRACHLFRPPQDWQYVKESEAKA